MGGPGTWGCGGVAGRWFCREAAGFCRDSQGREVIGGEVASMDQVHHIRTSRHCLAVFSGSGALGWLSVLNTSTCHTEDLQCAVQALLDRR